MPKVKVNNGSRKGDFVNKVVFEKVWFEIIDKQKHKHTYLVPPGVAEYMERLEKELAPKKLVAKIVESEDIFDVDDVFFDITMLVNKQGEVIIIDNVIENINDYSDCDILASKSFKLSIT